MLGNLMKSTATRLNYWPRYLRHMRELCRFFKNDSYRQHIRRRLHPLSALAKEALGKAFTAGFAKWRYETVAEALRQIGDLREVCEKLTILLFAHAQEQDHIARVMEACRDAKFLSWVVVAGREIFQVLEALRRWGIICDCPDHLAERARLGRGKHIDCNSSSVVSNTTTTAKFTMKHSGSRFVLVFNSKIDSPCLVPSMAFPIAIGGANDNSYDTPTNIIV